MLNTFARSNPVRFFLLSLTALAFAARAQTFELKQDDPYFEPFHPTPAPPIAGLMLKKGDRLAICGGSPANMPRLTR